MKAGRYEIREKLGEGGMGIVYLAIDPFVNREVTVKTIRDPQDDAALELFKKECAVLASMTHPNIIEIFNVGETEESGVKRPYFVMPRLAGLTLKELIDNSSPRLTVERSVQMMIQVCRGLQAAHEHGLIHRDLKPSNLFVLSDDSVKIIDFGMAHLVNQRSTAERNGTPPYLAPEQLQRRQPTARSDQFSLAVVCYEVLARRHPFADQENVATAIETYSPPPIFKWNPLVGSGLCQVVHKALAKQPLKRFSDVRQFADYLQKALRGDPVERVLDPEQLAEYQKLDEEVRSERAQLSSKEPEVRQVLGDAQAERQDVSASPAEPRSEESLQQAKARRDRVDAMAGRARALEEERQFSDALREWEMLGRIHPKFPGLDIHMERLKKRREQQMRDEAKTHWIMRIDQASEVPNYAEVAALVDDALKEFPGDLELTAIAKQTQQARSRAAEAEEKAHAPLVRNGLIEALLKEAGSQIDHDWRIAEPLVREALDLDPGNTLAESLATLIQDKRQDEEISAALSRARELQAEGRIVEAIAEIDTVKLNRREPRLIHLRNLLCDRLPPQERAERRVRDLEEVNRLAKEAKEATSPEALESIFLRTDAFAQYGGDPEFQSPLSTIEVLTQAGQEGTGAAPPPIAIPVPVSTDERAAGPVARPIPPPAQPETPSEKRQFRFHWLQLQWLRPVLGVVLVIVFGFALKRLFFGAKNPTASRPVAIKVEGADRDQFEIYDGNGTQISEPANGLLAGNYVLKARKSGYRYEHGFSIEPADGPAKSLSVAWQPLSAKLLVQLSQPIGTWKIDGMDQMATDSTFSTEWMAGPHTARWSSDADFAEIQFEVNDATVVIKDVSLPRAPRLYGLVAVRSLAGVSYQSLNVSGSVIKFVDGKPEALSSPQGVFTVESGERIGFKGTRYGTSLGEFQVDPNGAPQVYIYLVTASRATSGITPKPPPPAPEPIVADPPPPPPPLPPTPDPAIERAKQRCDARTKAGLPCDEKGK